MKDMNGLRLQSCSMMRIKGDSFVSINNYSDGSRLMTIEESTINFLYRYWHMEKIPVLNPDPGSQEWRGFVVDEDGNVYRVNRQGELSKKISYIGSDLDDLIEDIKEIQQKLMDESFDQD